MSAVIDRLLVTGFAPWEGHPVNSSALAIEPLDGIEIGGIKLKTLVLPVDFDASVRALLAAAAEFQPDAVVSFGMLSKGPDVWRVELVAANADGRGIAPDADVERAPLDEKLPRFLASGLPVARILGRLLEAGLPAELSESAGRFVCNHLFFESLRAAEAGLLPPFTGLIHVPPPQFKEGQDTPVNLDPLHEGARLVTEAVLSQAGDRAGVRP